MKITKTKKGYTTVISLGKDENGKQHTKRFTAAEKDDLKQIVIDYKSAHKKYAESRVFSDALQRYIDARMPHKSPSTMRGYISIQTALKGRYGALCALTTDDIKDRDVQVVVDDMKAKGKTEKTIRNYVGLINAVLISEGMTPVHPIMPAKKVYDSDLPTIGDIKKLLCLMHGTRFDIPFQLSLLGMRRGEVCSLTSEDIDAAGIAHIHRSMVKSKDNVWIINDVPKTSASNRFIQLPAWLADRIREDGVTIMNPDMYTLSFMRFLRKYRFPAYRLHDMRHFFASYCHSHGISEADILAAGGWRDGSTVMRRVYRHSMAQNTAGSKIVQTFNL